jgi:hypothetical protein
MRNTGSIENINSLVNDFVVAILGIKSDGIYTYDLLPHRLLRFVPRNEEEILKIFLWYIITEKRNELNKTKI